MISRKTHSYLVLAICLMGHVVMGQQQKKLVTLGGDIGLHGEFYKMESEGGVVKARRPGTLCRLIINTTLSTKDFSMPITMALPTGQYGDILPYAPAMTGVSLANLKQVMRNPLNRVAIAPKYKWAQLILGSQSPNYSELSVGNIAVWGTGINLSPGKFRLSCFSGSSQLAIEENLKNNISGIYSRKIYSIKTGFGHQDSSHIYFIQSMMKDDTSSLQVKPSKAMPQSGFLSSLDFRINLSKQIYIKGEVAASAFTRDMSSDEVPAPSSSFNPLGIFTKNGSARLDYASVLSIGTDRKNFGIKTVATYYGDGFVPMGYPFLQTDRLEVTVDPRFTLFKSKLQVSGSIGKRANNVSGTKAATTTQSIGSANINARFSDKISIAASFSNFGYRNSVMNDTFRLEMVSWSWSISPSYTYTSSKSLNNFTLMYSQNTFKDFNVLSGALNANEADNIALSYMLSMLKNPFSFSTMLSYFDNNASYGSLLTKSLRLNFGYKFFKKKLSTTAGIMLAHNEINSASSGSQVMILSGAKYALTQKLFFSLNTSINMFHYGETRPGLSYRENFLRTSIIYKF